MKPVELMERSIRNSSLPGNGGRRRHASDGIDVLALVAPDSVSQRQGQEALFAS
jgi:hypothetical protein